MPTLADAGRIIPRMPPIGHHGKRASPPLEGLESSYTLHITNGHPAANRRSLVPISSPELVAAYDAEARNVGSTRHKDGTKLTLAHGGHPNAAKQVLPTTYSLDNRPSGYVLLCKTSHLSPNFFGTVASKDLPAHYICTRHHHTYTSRMRSRL